MYYVLTSLVITFYYSTRIFSTMDSIERLIQSRFDRIFLLIRIPVHFIYINLYFRKSGNRVRGLFLNLDPLLLCLKGCILHCIQKEDILHNKYIQPVPNFVTHYS